MPRPGLRPMRALPLLEPRRDALEKCVFCPKLCRSACPVSNAEPRETLTPWGKMSAAWMAAHGDVPSDGSHAAPAWACTACYGCREACDHRNVVADVLVEARDALARTGVAPEAARRTVTRFGRHAARTRAAARALLDRVDPARVSAEARDAVLVGCGYLRTAQREARDAVEAASLIAGGPVTVLDRCCGLPLLFAGDALGFTEQAREMARLVSRHARVWVADAGCALALKRRYAALGVEVRPAVETIVEGAARSLESLAPLGEGTEGPVRWHDPCQLGRGLGIYDEPRAVLTRALGRAPDELLDRRELSVCSGAGGLLPSTMPEVARAIAAERLRAHEAAGGGRVITGCASSLLALRRRAASSGVEVDDLVTWIAEAARAAIRSPAS